VSGKVPTDEFWLNSLNGSIKRRLIADNKTHRIGLAEVNDGTRDEALPEDAKSSACLTDAQIATLFQAVKALDKAAFKSPQDLEFCFDKAGQLYLLQSRPITTHCENLVWNPPDIGLWRLNAVSFLMLCTHTHFF